MVEPIGRVVDLGERRVLQGFCWVVGSSLSGKTSYLVTAFQDWSVRLRESQDLLRSGQQDSAIYPKALVLSAIGDNRLVLSDRLTALTQAQIPFRSTTPLGFMEEELLLFWPLLVKKLGLRPQFPVRLRPENEQELATNLWRSQLEPVIEETGIQLQRLVRRLLDIYQLAAFSETPLVEIPMILAQGLGSGEELSVELPVELPLPPERVGEMLLSWRSWCLDRGLLNYGILTELYGQFLLNDPQYQLQLPRRIQAVFADDVDEYPPVMRSLFEQLLKDEAEIPIVCTFNPNGGIRLGLGADPAVMAEMEQGWERVELPDRVEGCFGIAGIAMLDLVNPVYQPGFGRLPDCIQTIQTSTRAQLLRQTAEMIIEQIQSGEVQAQEIAIVAPGFDPISRYALTEMLMSQGIRVNNLNEQRPLTTVPIVRSLLTLLTLIYPNLGRLVTRDAVAEMLVILNDKIDPVRSGLLVDYCFEPHPDRPKLLSSQTFPRWDRLGYAGVNAYEDLIAWIGLQQEQLASKLISNPMVLLDRAIQKFFSGAVHLPFEQISSLRELLDTAQHYWEVDQRVRQYEAQINLQDWLLVQSSTLRSFIQLLRSGAVNANPYPVRAIGQAKNAVTIASVFQYRLNRESHRYQYWFDASSDRWLTGVDALFASPLFLQDWSGQCWTPMDTLRMHEQRLERIIRDLLERAGDRIILCHSDLATNGQEQLGPLITAITLAS